MDIFDLLEAYRYEYDDPTSQVSTLMYTGDPVIPVFTPNDRLLIRPLLPVSEGSATFTVSDRSVELYNSGTTVPYLIRLTQTGGSINGKYVHTYMGRLSTRETTRPHRILDGAHVQINVSDIGVSASLVWLGERVLSVSGYRSALVQKVNQMQYGYGTMFCLFVHENSVYTDGVIVPSMLETTLLEYQLGDYNSLYARLTSEYGLSYTSPGYIELCRGQILSQFPSEPHVSVSTDGIHRESHL